MPAPGAGARTPSHPFAVLIPHEAIVRRIAELARRIGGDFATEPPCVVAVMEGARTFARHLRPRLPGRPAVHEIRASSYGEGARSTGKVKVLTGHHVPVPGRDVLLVEDIVETGSTIAALQSHLQAAGARSVRVVALLDKPSGRTVDVTLDYTGFRIPDEFVVGFGMDLGGRWRELPDVAVYDAAAAARAAG